MEDAEGVIKRVIDAAIAVHIELGPGFVESIYEKALTFELQDRGIGVSTQLPIDVHYHGRIAGQHRLDMLVDDMVIIENKTVRNLDPVFFAIVRSYMRSAGKRHALLLNFAKERLEIKRVYPHQ